MRDLDANSSANSQPHRWQMPQVGTQTGVRSDVAMKADEEKACWDERFDKLVKRSKALRDHSAELFEDAKRLKHNTAIERDQA